MHERCAGGAPSARLCGGCGEGVPPHEGIVRDGRGRRAGAVRERAPQLCFPAHAAELVIPTDPVDAGSTATARQVVGRAALMVRGAGARRQKICPRHHPPTRPVDESVVVIEGWMVVVRARVADGPAASVAPAIARACGTGVAAGARAPAASGLGVIGAALSDEGEGVGGPEGDLVAGVEIVGGEGGGEEETHNENCPTGRAFLGSARSFSRRRNASLGRVRSTSSVRRVCAGPVETRVRP